MIHVLPGMGADSSMFRGEWRTLNHCAFLDWPSYRGEQSLRAIAERLLHESGIQRGDTVIGHSLGGMVACEIAARCQLKRLILLGSASGREEVSVLLAALHPLAALTPFRFVQTLVGKLPGNLYEMFVRSDPEFIRATCKAIFEWNGLVEGSAPVTRIHGRHDRVIPLPAHVDHIIEGGHLIPITHARACVEAVQTVL